MEGAGREQPRIATNTPFVLDGLLGHASNPSATSDPIVFVLFLFGPGGHLFRELVEDSAPYIDTDSAQRVHWIMVGNPRRSKKYFREFVEHVGINFREYDRRWAQILTTTANERDATLEAEGIVVKQLELGRLDLPAVALFVDGSYKPVQTIRLPRRSLLNATDATAILGQLESEFNSATLNSAAAMRLRDKIAAVQDDLRARASRLEGEWMGLEARAEPAPSVPAASELDGPVLTAGQCEVLAAMQDLEAVDSDHRRTGEDIALRATGDNDPGRVKESLARLRHFKLVQSKTGRGGGSWLTEAGIDRCRTITKERRKQ